MIICCKLSHIYRNSLYLPESWFLKQIYDILSVHNKVVWGYWQPPNHQKLLILLLSSSQHFHNIQLFINRFQHVWKTRWVIFWNTILTPLKLLRYNQKDKLSSHKVFMVTFSFVVIFWVLLLFAVTKWVGKQGSVPSILRNPIFENVLNFLF